MKKKIFISLLTLSMCLTLTSCKKETPDYSQYLFTDITWSREADHDTETIRFSSDGSFSYFCDCGDPVNDANLCRIYSYNDKTKEIKLECTETTEDTITIIKLVSCDENNLELNFDGEIRNFVKK